MIDVAIIGGGFSGTLLAVNLVRHEGPSALLFERNHKAGLGLAYSTSSNSHLLNVRAANMSALPDDPGHFERWAQAECGAERTSFVPRATYGRYLNSLLEEARAQAPHQLTVHAAEVIGIRPEGEHFQLLFANGERQQARRVVLATGNLPARAPAGLDPAALGDAYCNDPWEGELMPPAGPDSPVLLIGTGLTAIDAALLLREAGHGGEIVALSRRGLIPRVHGAPEPVPPLPEAPAADTLSILRHLRAQAKKIGWRAAVDQLRPHTQDLWRRMPLAEKQRFLRHARVWWDVHRHRMAPEVAGQVKHMVAAGDLRVIAGRILSAERTETGARLEIQRKDASTQTLKVGRIVNCTGPGDVARSAQPLIRSLLDGGLARPDELGMGLETDHLGRVIAPDGAPNSSLFAVGPLTRGSFWETTAVPDIRRQVWSLARMLSNAHWVGGEGL
ncbi:FAD/NAD(P)-binding protein [Sandaracinobacter sp. RS1-74]|uniref:FAD/NAD(P)-binding protein n=1 Tax=Sandaracinobacteroides sayramensis TaxID=2913411 RepID=UPI001EDB75BA|nr:FAD/NAD(P)-binding protein [Sandaracinobacteroides sayramensis]MCG2842642.1 FAD/NAD(P)-binding protein [Sandaracinobacteroides sayramensis]